MSYMSVCIKCGNQILGRRKLYCSKDCYKIANKEIAYKRYKSYNEKDKITREKRIKGNPEKYKEKNKMALDRFISKNRDRFNELMRNNYQRNKLKQKARSLALSIIIPIGKKCDSCRLRLATQRHHKDYNKPLDIEFLCNKCHCEKHNPKRI